MCGRYFDVVANYVQEHPEPPTYADVGMQTTRCPACDIDTTVSNTWAANQISTGELDGYEVKSIRTLCGWGSHDMHIRFKRNENGADVEKSVKHTTPI